MGLLSQLRQDTAAFIADAEVSLPLDASSVAATASASFTAYVVSPPEEWLLPDADWLPPVVRGVPVFLPADDWWIPDWIVEAGKPSPAPPADRRQREAGGPSDQLCPECGCPLFWEPIGQIDSLKCIECSPPVIRRMVEDLWLVDGSGELDCVSKSSKWIRAAFAHLKPAEDQRREEAVSKAAKENEGF